MRSPLPTDIDLLIYLANGTGHRYEEAYAIWAQFYLHSESYLITETVLDIAREYRLPVMRAVAVYRQGTASEYVREPLSN